MNIDKSKMTPEDLAALEAIEKKYGTGEASKETATPPTGDVAKGADADAPMPPAETTPAAELHPEVKKALDENKALTARVEEMQKSLEIKDLSISAKKYEIIGKKADELAPKLYELKKAGGTAFDDFVGLLDEQVTLVEKGNLFGEIGSARGNNSGGGAFDAAVNEIKKNNHGMSHAAAIAKAYEENPHLAAEYEKSYAGSVN